MNVTEIQKRIDGLIAQMLAKGLRKPVAHFTIRANEQIQAYLSWEKPGKGRYESDNFEFFNGDNTADILAKAGAFIAAMPSADETKFKEFMGALGGVIDLGRKNGIEVEFLNPLVATMKKLSTNALTNGAKDAA